MKKYRWLKMPDDFFASPLIKKLRKMENGDTCVVVYQKLLLFSVGTNGVLTFDGIEDEFSDELALKIDECPDNIKTVMAFMQKHGLICDGETDAEFFLTEATKNLGKENDSAERVRQHREKQTDVTPAVTDVTPAVTDVTPAVTDVTPAVTDVTPAVTECNALEKEKEKEKVKTFSRGCAENPAPKNELAEIRQAYSFGEPLDSAVDDWLKYKAEKKQEYKPAGLKSLLAQIGREASLHGAEAVAAAIAVSMASNYQGIIWDKIGGPGHADARASPGGPARRTLETRNEKNNRVLDELFAENARMFGKGGGDVAGRLEVLP